MTGKSAETQGLDGPANLVLAELAVSCKLPDMPKGKPHDTRIDVRGHSEEIALWRLVAEHIGAPLSTWMRAELNRAARKYAAAHGLKLPRS